jgi:outer membrane protein OmpA-like peptidoglycan-associated protein
MSPTPVTSRILALAALGLMLAAEASAQVQPAANVTAFNPYTSGGWGRSGQPREYPDGPVLVVPDSTIAAPPSQGLAFNPWRRNVQPPAAITPYGTYNEPDPTANLPSPPAGPIRSRLLAVVQRGDGPRQTASVAPRPAPQRNGTNVTVAAAPPTEVRAERPSAPPRPQVAAAPPPPPRVAAPPPPVAAPPVAAPPPAAAPPPTEARATPQPPAPAPAPATSGAGTRVLFDGTSAELSAEGRAVLDQLAAAIVSRNTRQIELRAYAGGTSPEARKVSLARALVVRSYLIDKGVKSRIDVGAFLADGQSGPADRVDIVAPN